MQISTEDIETMNAVHSACPVCGSANVSSWATVNDYAIDKCGGCSLVFVKSIPTPEELNRHYARAHVEADAYSPDNVECLNFYYDALRELLEARHPQRGKLLDIGCSGGWFLDRMAGWERHGSEIVTSDAVVARKKHGDRIVSGQFEEYPLRENYFDVITLQDVFDHMRDPMGTLKKCQRMLKPGGTIVVKVHNISCLYAKLTGKRFYAVVPPTHLFYYDDKSLPLALERSGFRVVSKRFLAHLMKVKTVFLRLSQGDKDSVLQKFYLLLNQSSVGNVKIKKNLHDIITVIAEKPSA